MKWLIDKPNLDDMTVVIRERGKRGTDKTTYSLSFSKSFKDYVGTIGKPFIRFGHDVVDGFDVLVFQLNEDEIGLPLFNDKNQVRIWIDIKEYVVQYLDSNIDIPFDVDLPVSVKKNGNLIVDLPKTTTA